MVEYKKKSRSTDDKITRLNMTVDDCVTLFCLKLMSQQKQAIDIHAQSMQKTNARQSSLLGVLLEFDSETLREKQWKMVFSLRSIIRRVPRPL